MKNSYINRLKLIAEFKWSRKEDFTDMEDDEFFYEEPPKSDDENDDIESFDFSGPTLPLNCNLNDDLSE